jgi:hypothetical protein
MKRMVIAVCCVMLFCATQQPAMAISVDLAKKCRALAIKAYPYKMPGTSKGDSAAERQYFTTCVSRNGNMPNTDKSSDQTSPGTTTPTNAQGASGTTKIPDPTDPQPTQK